MSGHRKFSELTKKSAGYVHWRDHRVKVNFPKNTIEKADFSHTVYANTK